MICKACKMDIPNGATICPHCRTRQAAVTSSGLKGAFAFVAGAAALIFTFGGGGDDDTTAKDTNDGAVVTETSTEQAYSETQEKVIEYLDTQVKSTLGSNTNVEYSAETNTYTVSFWREGMCEVASSGTRTQEWADMASSAAIVSSTLLEDIRRTDPAANLCFNLLNENNHDNALIMTMNGTVIYDILGT